MRQHFPKQKRYNLTGSSVQTMAPAIPSIIRSFLALIY
jgi:hypothetical protein